jgi:hypothetical protein
MNIHEELLTAHIRTHFHFKFSTLTKPGEHLHHETDRLQTIHQFVVEHSLLTATFIACWHCARYLETFVSFIYITSLFWSNIYSPIIIIPRRKFSLAFHQWRRCIFQVYWCFYIVENYLHISYLHKGIAEPVAESILSKLHSKLVQNVRKSLVSWFSTTISVM